MKTIKVKDMMVPLEGYPAINEEATLYEAVVALEEAMIQFEKDWAIHTAVLVHDNNNEIIGKVSQIDLIRGLEAGYREMGDIRHISRSGLNPNFLRSMIANYSLWEEPMAEICGKASHIKVKDFMYRPTAGEYVEEDDSLDAAIHQLVMGDHRSLLVTKSGKITGILHLSDVFRQISEEVKTCKV